MEAHHNENDYYGITAMINLVLWVCSQSTVSIMMVTHVSEVVDVLELIKMMVTLSLSIVSTLFMYIINRRKIDLWFKSITWFKKKKKNEGESY